MKLLRRLLPLVALAVAATTPVVGQAQETGFYLYLGGGGGNFDSKPERDRMLSKMQSVMLVDSANTYSVGGVDSDIPVRFALGYRADRYFALELGAMKIGNYAVYADNQLAPATGTTGGSSAATSVTINSCSMTVGTSSTTDTTVTPNVTTTTNTNPKYCIGRYTEEAKVTGVYLDVLAHVPLIKELTGILKVGTMRTITLHRCSTTGQIGTALSCGLDDISVDHRLHYGVGLQWQKGPLGLRLERERIDNAGVVQARETIDVELTTLGVIYHF